jgi:hypothetical protein
MVKRLMKRLGWAFFHLRLWAFELKQWLDGLSWEQVRIVAERQKDLASFCRETPILVSKIGCAIEISWS